MVTRGDSKNKRKPGGISSRSIKHPLPQSHPAVDAPLCTGCRKFDLALFDPSCPGCLEIVKNPATTIGEIFAIIRQWVPQTQKNIELFANEILQRGAHVDDCDSLTDMTLLHYSCKAGASGVGDVHSSLKVIEKLLDRGASVSLRCKWTNMSALHYAAYFNAADVVKFLIEKCKGIDVNSRCESYNNGTALHIAAKNLCLDAAQVLLDFGANVLCEDGLSKTPLECIPDTPTYDLIPDIQDIVIKMQKLLSSEPNSASEDSRRVNAGGISGKAVLNAMNLHLNERVIIGADKSGVLRYCGSTEFAPGIWAGVQLDESEGRNDGSVRGVVYFKCPHNHGIFAPIERVRKANDVSVAKMPIPCKSNSKTPINCGKVDVSHVTSKVCTGLNIGFKLKDLRCGDKVIVRRNSVSRGSENQPGLVRYIGTTDFASGIWVGIELNKDTYGRHDGSIAGKRYFSCPHHRGILIPISRLKRFSSDSSEAATFEDKESAGNIWETFCTSTKKKNFPADSQAVPSSSKGLKTKHKYWSSSAKHTSNVPPFSTYRGCNYKDITQRKNNGSVRSDLTLGMNALYNHKIGIVKYIGPVEFADGNWLGLELREQTGKHDGFVNGRQYFTSKPGHGIMVPSKNVTIRGINGEKLATEYLVK